MNRGPARGRSIFVKLYFEPKAREHLQACRDTITGKSLEVFFDQTIEGVALFINRLHVPRF
jgi:hypothetical protein